VNSENQEKIVDYLNAGGSVYMESSNVGYNHHNTEMFSYFGADFVAQGGNYEVSSLNGESGAITDGLAFNYEGGADSHYYVDRLSPTTGLSLFQSNDAVKRVIANENRNYRSIISSVLLGCFSNGAGNNTRAYVMEQYLSFLDVENQAEGEIAGYVLDNFSHEPVSNATLTIGEEEIFIDENGYFTAAMLPGSYLLHCAHPNYYDFEQEVFVIAGETNSISIYLEPLTDSHPDLLPLATKLAGNYPNPFNPTTTISYSLRTKSPVRLVIFNQKGQLVTELVNEAQNPGFYEVSWNGKDKLGKQTSSGIYFYQFISDELTQTNKMLLLK
jgi:hypothetical protein